MSKYTPLWEHISSSPESSQILSYEAIEQVLGFEIDHSFLTFKKELQDYGWSVKKISMKEKMVLFEKTLTE